MALIYNFWLLADNGIALSFVFGIPFQQFLFNDLKFYHMKNASSVRFCVLHFFAFLGFFFPCVGVFDVKAQITYTYTINLGTSANPLAKPGYNLIFHDEFDVFDPEVWDVSTPGNDGLHYGDPEICSEVNSKNAPKNTDNVLPVTTVPDLLPPPVAPAIATVLPLRVKVGESMGACSHSSAEIKSFRDPYGEQTFKNWKIYPNSFVEMRVKVPKCIGVGGAGWLYSSGINGVYNEIDIFELFGNSFSTYQTNFHWGKVRKIDPQTLDLEDTNGNQFDIGDQFMIFGMETSPGRIDFYLNNTWVGWKKLRYYKKNNFCTVWDPEKSVQPMSLRLTVGSSTLDGSDITDCGSLPTSMLIDYVRVYTPVGKKAVKFLGGTTNKMTLCGSSFLGWPDGAGYAVTYYPNATYTWLNPPAFVNIFEDNSKDEQMYYWISIPPGTPSGIHNLKLRIDFPDGHTETMPLKLTINNTPPPNPPNIIHILQIDNGEKQVYVDEDPYSVGYSWSEDGGPWVYVPNEWNSQNRNVCPFTFPFQTWSYAKNICVRAEARCVNQNIPSGSYCTAVVIPSGCGGCLQKPTQPDDVEVVGEDCLYGLRTQASFSSTEYLWSYDSIEWDTVQRLPSEPFAYYGFGSDGVWAYPCNSPDFDIFVKAMNADFTTPALKKKITIPTGDCQSNTSKPHAYEETVSKETFDRDSQPLEEADFHTIAIFNLMGQSVKSMKVHSKRSKVDASDLPTGIYFIHVTDSQGRSVSVKKTFILNR